MTTGLMGMPGTSTQNVAAVGPMAEGALASVADRVNGLLPGILYASRSDSETRVGNGDTPENPGSASVLPADPPEVVSLTAAAKPETAGNPTIRGSWRRSNRLLGLADWFQGEFTPAWLGGMFNTTTTKTSGAPNTPEILAQPDIPAHSRPRNRRGHLIDADLTIPLGVIVATAAAYHLAIRSGNAGPATKPRHTSGLGVHTSSPAAALIPRLFTFG